MRLAKCMDNRMLQPHRLRLVIPNSLGISWPMCTSDQSRAPQEIPSQESWYGGPLSLQCSAQSITRLPEDNAPQQLGRSKCPPPTVREATGYRWGFHLCLGGRQARGDLELWDKCIYNVSIIF